MRSFKKYYFLVLLAAALIIGGTLLASCIGKVHEDPGASSSTKEAEESPATKETEPENSTKATEETADTAEDTETAKTEASEDTDEASAESSDEQAESSESETETEPEETTESTDGESSGPEESVPLRDPEAIIDTTTTLYTYDKMQDDLHYLAAVYPQLLSLHSAGTTEDGRDLTYVIFGNPDAARQIYICAATHAREYMTTQLVMRQLAFYCTEYESGSYNGIPFREIFANTCFYVEPMVNPDGVSISQLGADALRREDLRENLHRIFEADLANGTAETADYAAYLVRWKANALGVDINRNYSPGWETVMERSGPSSTFYKGAAPGSERETQAQMSIVNSMTNPLMAISYHSYGDLVYWQYGQPEPLWSANQQLAQHISNMTGQYLAGYSNEAGFSNWCIAVKNLRSVTVETGTVPAPLPLEQFSELWPEHRYIWAMLATVY